jgi:G3E family GTPase
MLLTEDLGAFWPKNEVRESVLVFIGRNLPKLEIYESLDACRVI